MIMTKNRLMNLGLTAAVWAWSFAIASSLPESMPIHFDIAGQPNGYAPKYIVLALLPCINLFCIDVNILIARWSPKCAEGPNARYLAMFETIMTLFLCAIHIAIVMEARYPGRDIFANAIIPALSLLTIVIGNSMGKLQPNKFIGIRTPWTMRSEENWKKTHRFSGKLFVYGGLVMLACALVPYGTWVSVVVMILLPAVAILYSYRMSRMGTPQG